VVVERFMREPGNDDLHGMFKVEKYLRERFAGHLNLERKFIEHVVVSLDADRRRQVAQKHAGDILDRFGEDWFSIDIEE
jgi:hypothetical protein